MREKLAVIGAGNMAEAIVRGVLGGDSGYRTDDIVAADVSGERREIFWEQLNVRAFKRATDATRGAGIVMLSVKPQQIVTLLAELKDAIEPNALIISIAAGVPTQRIESSLGGTRRVIRAMPNTPMLVGEGAVAIARGAHATADDMQTARTIFESAAAVIEVREDQIDAVTALSASGPAYFFYLVEHMIRAGERNGLSNVEATLLARRTAIGAGAMLANRIESAQELRRRVTSPGGTTAAAIASFEAAGFDRIIIDAITAATERGRELAKNA